MSAALWAPLEGTWPPGLARPAATGRLPKGHGHPVTGAGLRGADNGVSC